MLGDARTFSDDGLRALFGGPRFEAPAIARSPVTLRGTAQDAWAALDESYDVAMLDGATRARLRDRFCAAIGDGEADLAIGLRLVHVIRR